MRMALLFWAMGIGWTVVAVREGGWGWLLVWPAVTCVVVGLAYAGMGARVYGKRPDGRSSAWAVALLLPYRVMAWMGWRLGRLMSREPCANEVAPELWVGRRALAHELPQRTTLIVDLTAEFGRSHGVKAGRDYCCLPILDGGVPDEAAFVALAARLATERGCIYIHCAQGHGRSAMLAAAVLIAREAATNVADAEQCVKRARPGIKLSAVQRNFLSRVERALLSLRESHRKDASTA